MIVSYELKENEFKKISSIIYDTCRISLHNGKKELVQARLSKRLRKLGMLNFKKYLSFVESNREEFTIMVDYLSTNLTSFFREPQHFEFLKKEVFPFFITEKVKRLRIWSAGCSSGEEPYSLAILIKEYFENARSMDSLVLGTDISTRMLKAARDGVYTQSRLKNVPESVKTKHFVKLNNGDMPLYRIKPEVQNLVRIRYLNLMDSWPMKGPFDVIFCRNVMIYFDKKTQNELINRFHGILKAGGILIVGHSESLAGIEHDFKYVRPTIYMKKLKTAED